jgi:hypothetical protein
LQNAREHWQQRATTGCTKLVDVTGICRVERMNASNTCAQGSHSVAVMYEVSHRLEQCGEARPLVCFCYSVGRGRVKSDTCRAPRAGVLHLTSSDPTRCCTLENSIQKKQKQKASNGECVAISKTVQIA